ncbi:hypothetical protein M431DRAFT_265497 [Trichoderma harzianum CBS 226.95]|uniref:Uncharacterized protein n=1 Tax=Trichoderma harzianum CBS 226.95 TaxID=983964 RepID=A0A2T3ZY94_TRIHA|nr:hypothetical protein M431DRAFT_265497 [Trichoderma harzianum CBS 226.95]PTB49703.1 hypothetical protein M431DRAFT_265497 [Trichoderma harzianum CBS 226.95]
MMRFAWGSIYPEFSRLLILQSKKDKGSLYGRVEPVHVKCRQGWVTTWLFSGVLASFQPATKKTKLHTRTALVMLFGVISVH